MTNIAKQSHRHAIQLKINAEIPKIDYKWTQNKEALFDCVTHELACYFVSLL